MKIDNSELIKSDYDLSNVDRDLHEMAYFHWINAGKPEGRDLEFWHDAEREMFGWTMEEMAKEYDEYNRQMENDRSLLSTEEWLYQYGS